MFNIRVTYSFSKNIISEDINNKASPSLMKDLLIT